jgi:predicted alpha/beta superfamily hydrolase
MVKAIKLTIVILVLCLLTLVISWFVHLHLYVTFINAEPYKASDAFFIADIIVTFLVYLLASFIAIKITKLPVFIATLPVGLTGAAMYFIEMGGLNCLGVCGPPLWYDLISFVTHLSASILISFIVLYKQKSKHSSANNIAVVNKPKQLNSSLTIKVMFALSPLSAIGIILWGNALFTGISHRIKTITVDSKLLQEKRQVSVFLPFGYNEDSNKKYDVLYTLDGESIQHNYLAAATAKILADFGVIPQIIIVAVNGQGKRSRDFKLANARAVDGRDMAGKASVFYSFLNNELTIKIDNRFNTSSRKLLAGHSDGGLFTTTSFIQHPETFDGYFAFSPSLNANNKSIEMLKQMFSSTPNLTSAIYLNLGVEYGDMRSAFKQAEQVLRNQSPSKLKSKVNYYTLPHALIMIPGYFDALYWYYQSKR